MFVELYCVVHAVRASHGLDEGKWNVGVCVISQSGSDESDQVDARLPLKVLVIAWGMCGARTMRKRLHGRQNLQRSG